MTLVKVTANLVIASRITLPLNLALVRSNRIAWPSDLKRGDDDRTPVSGESCSLTPSLGKALGGW